MEIIVAGNMNEFIPQFIYVSLWQAYEPMNKEDCFLKP